MMGIIEKFKLDGRTAIVTGGAGLLGAEFCRTIISAGGKVVIADRYQDSAIRLEEELASESKRAKAIQVDISSRESVNNLVVQTLEWSDRVDILVNSAALDPKFDPAHSEQQTLDFESFPLDAWNAGISVNLTGAFLCAQAVGRVMAETGRGVIINIGSTYGLVGPDQRIYQKPDQPKKFKPAYYTVSKAGIHGLTKYLATYYEGTEIRVNTLTPGGVFNDHDQDFLAAYSERTILGRMAQKDEMNGALLFLISDASSYMTGANLIVDGGWTAW